MKYRLGLYSAVLLSVLGCASQPVSKIEQLAEKVVDSNASRYQIHLPSDYEASQAPYPLLVFLHGNGDKGSDMQIGSGANLLLQQAPQKGFVVAIPQLPFDHAQWSPEVVHTLIDDIETRYRIDPGKISLGGYSLGGFGSLGAAMAQPERFAALFSIAGGDPLHLSSWTLPGQESMPVDQAMMCRIADIPTWIFHGSRDLIVPVGAAVEVNMAYQSCGGEAKLTIYSEREHDAWMDALQEPALYDWLWQQRSHSLPDKAEINAKIDEGSYRYADSQLTIFSKDERLWVRVDHLGDDSGEYFINGREFVLAPFTEKRFSSQIGFFEVKEQGLAFGRLGVFHLLSEE